MKKILVVDDNLDTRELTHLHLTTEGFTVIIAADAREGLYMAGVEHPDLIITDISMPGFTGIDMIKELRQQPDLANIPIIVLTVALLLGILRRILSSYTSIELLLLKVPLPINSMHTLYKRSFAVLFF